jgi:hypothetical protein
MPRARGAPIAQYLWRNLQGDRRAICCRLSCRFAVGRIAQEPGEAARKPRKVRPAGPKGDGTPPAGRGSVPKVPLVKV